MNGTSPGVFSPNAALSRGMAVTVLYRMAGSPDVSGIENPFSDVAGGQWYTNAAVWAAENGIVSGYGGGMFGHGDDNTREQLAAILYRYMDFAGYDMAVTQQYIAFADEEDISGYAMEAIQTLNKLGIINGVGGNAIDPKGGATRAQFAALIHRLPESVKP
jgi:hypothetical protein